MKALGSQSWETKNSVLIVKNCYKLSEWYGKSAFLPPVHDVTMPAITEICRRQIHYWHLQPVPVTCHDSHPAGLRIFYRWFSLLLDFVSCALKLEMDSLFFFVSNNCLLSVFALKLLRVCRLFAAAGHRWDSQAGGYIFFESRSQL